MRVYAKHLFEDGAVEYDNICQALQTEKNYHNIRIENVEIAGKMYAIAGIGTDFDIHELANDYTVVYEQIKNCKTEKKLYI